MRAKHTIAAALAAATLMQAPASASTLFSQPADRPADANASQNDTGPSSFGNFATQYDDFTLGTAAQITGVDFHGLYFNGSPSYAISQFTIGFWADNAGQPGALLGSTAVAGNGGESCAFDFCSYSVATSFAASAGTRYWMSIVPDVAFPPQWGWSYSSVGNGVSFQDFLGSRSPVQADMAFTLNGRASGNAVPEPSTWAMMVIGFGLAGTAMRRRRALVPA